MEDNFSKTELINCISIHSEESQIKDDILSIYYALKMKGYNPLAQISGYIVSRDPAFITNFEDARKIAIKYDVVELIEYFIKYFICKELSDINK